eukprot:8683273-Pyramimonas_sp.AAC.1
MLAFADTIKPQALVPQGVNFTTRAHNLNSSFSVEFESDMHARDFVGQVPMRARLDAPFVGQASQQSARLAMGPCG